MSAPSIPAPGHAIPAAPVPSVAIVGTAAGARVNVGSITMEAFMRSGAVQGYFGRNASQLREMYTSI